MLRIDNSEYENIKNVLLTSYKTIISVENSMNAECRFLESTILGISWNSWSRFLGYPCFILP